MPVHEKDMVSTGVTVAADGRKRFLFCLVRPDGKVQAVVDADSYDAAWTIATGWDDAAGIAERKAQGWRLYPCTVSWRPKVGKGPRRND